MPLTPNNREEHWLQGMVDGQTTLEPNKRREYWYKEIVDAIGSGGGGGGGGGVLVVEITPDGEESVVMDKTLKEIYDAAKDGLMFYQDDVAGGIAFFAPVSVINNALLKQVRVYDLENQTLMDFTASTENDYPTLTY